MNWGPGSGLILLPLPHFPSFLGPHLLPEGLFWVIRLTW